MKQYFGTDGIRGQANSHPMTPEVALLLGKAVGAKFRKGTRRHMVVVGKDTRLSGYMIEYSLIAGLTAAGMDVRSVGPVPTPAIGMLTRALRADLGVMITASHNGFQDNGIKLFGPDGFKLPDSVELEIESEMGRPPKELAAAPVDIGQVAIYQDAKGRYVEAAKSTFPRNLSLSGVKIVVDCANGAGYRVAPQALWELGADVDAIGVSPNGQNINANCGSTAPEAMARRVVETGADVGLALDGDADRLIICDERGHLIDGDLILARIAVDMKAAGRLAQPGVVGTIMSNLALETYLASEGLKLERTSVGDRYVVERLQSGGYNIGGEPSGHIIMSDYSTTGDGLIAGLQVLAALVREERPLSEICHLFAPAPQARRDVRFTGTSPLESGRVQAAKLDAEARLSGNGRLVLRKSGTEPLIRIMTEGVDEALVESVAADLASVIEELAHCTPVPDHPLRP
jgi:phosphoglucosamine mutase